MSSSIFFRFKSQKEPLQITFDGTSLSVFEVKRDIIAISKLGDGTDFDLEIYTPEEMEKYDDDTTQIPRSTTVIARRLPAMRPGAGRAARYVTGKMPVTAKNQHRIEFKAGATPNGAATTNGAPMAGKEMTEEEKMNAMFAANTEVWKADQAQMANKPIIRSTFNKSTAVPDKPLPPGYICHRCGDKGHWIQACPTNNDPTFDGRPKFKRTTGIPRSMLKVVEQPTELGEDGKVDVSKLPPGAMYTATGEWVIAEPDKAAWDKYKEKQDASAEKVKEAAAGDQELRDRGLECPVDQRMFVDPVKTPCCGKTYCRDCIENALLDNDLICPNCGEQVLLDKLETDEEIVTKMSEYAEEKKSATRKADEATSSTPAKIEADTPANEAAKSPTPNVSSAKANSAASPQAKKRPADGELENDRKPAGPAEMKKTNSNQGSSKPLNAPTGPKADAASAPMKIPGNMQDFAQHMQAMASSMPGMQGGMPAMMNPMNMGMGMPMGPMGMMGMPMMPGMNPAMMGMPGFGMGGGMNGMNGMNNGMYGPGVMNMGNGGGWQGNQGWNNSQNNNNGGMGMGMGMQNGGNNGAYFRQAVNPNRQQGRQRRQRSVDYKQMGS